jgi:hypothetical protein
MKLNLLMAGSSLALALAGPAFAQSNFTVN